MAPPQELSYHCQLMFQLPARRGEDQGEALLGHPCQRWGHQCNWGKCVEQGTWPPSQSITSQRSILVVKGEKQRSLGVLLRCKAVHARTSIPLRQQAHHLLMTPLLQIKAPLPGEKDCTPVQSSWYMSGFQGQQEFVLLQTISLRASMGNRRDLRHPPPCLFMYATTVVLSV